ncbi:armadillo-type protein [Blastocladiella britannica]|nr:armadillo-type protein [Blastocladiella britannica]
MPIPAAAAVPARSRNNLARAGPVKSAAGSLAPSATPLPPHALANIVLDPKVDRAKLSAWIEQARYTAHRLASNTRSLSAPASQRSTGTAADPSSRAGHPGEGAPASAEAATHDPLEPSLGSSQNGYGGKPVRSVQFAVEGGHGMEMEEGDDGEFRGDDDMHWSKVSGDIETALEAGLVHAVVHLIARLTPASDSISRASALHLLLDLASLLDEPHSQETALRAQLVALCQAPDPCPAVAKLLSTAGESLAPLAVAMVAGLATFLTHRDAAVRAVCATALSHLLAIHTKKFEDADRLAIVWDLFFIMSSSFSAATVAYSGAGSSASAGGPLAQATGRQGGGGGGMVGASSGSSSSSFSSQGQSNVLDRRDRVIIIEALARLTPIFQHHTEVAIQVCEGLFRVEGKTRSERLAIQDALTALNAGLPAPFPSLVVDLVRPEDDDALDLAWWAAEKLVPTVNLPALLDAHLLSPQPAVRYGCALLMDAYCHTHCDSLASIAAHLTLGYHDQTIVVSLVYRSLLAALGTDPVTMAAAPDATCPTDLLERVATGMDYLYPADRLHSLAFLDLWAPKAASSPPPLVIQSLVSCLQSNHSGVRSAALAVLAKMAPGMTGPGATSQVTLVWRYLCRMPSAAWSVSNGVFPAFAAHFRKAVSRDEYFNALFDRALFGIPAARQAVYLVLKGMASAPDPLDRSLAGGLLVLCLGDMDRPSLEMCMDAVLVFRPLLQPHLQKLAKAHATPASHESSHGYYAHVAVWDDLATTVADAGMTAEWAARDTAADKIWEFYLAGQPDHIQAPSPDEYNFTRTLTSHSALWLGMLMHRLGVPPPPVPRTERRGAVPTLITTRRRFHAGFMLTIFPMLGFPDEEIRQAASVAVVACAFGGGIVVTNETAKALLEYVTVALATHKTWSYVCSALYIACLLIRTKVPGIAPFLLRHFLGNALDWAVNSPMMPIRAASLCLINTVCAVFPLGTNAQLPEIRDATRQCLVDRDVLVAHVAVNVWSRIFSILTETNAPDFVQYVRGELNSIHSHSQAHVMGDPFLQHLSVEERKRLVALHIEAMGHVRHSSLASAIVQICLPFLSSPSVEYRKQAITSVLQQFPALKEVDRHVAGWACLPLTADLSHSVSQIVDKFAVGMLHSSLAAQSVAHPDDATVLPNPTLEEVLDANAALSIASENRVHEQTWALSAGSRHHQQQLPTTPESSEKRELLGQRLLQVPMRVERLAGWVPDSAISQVLYHLERATENPHIIAGALTALAEFCCAHEPSLEAVVELLLRHVLDRNPVAMAAMVRVGEHSPSAFRYLLSKLMGAMAATAELECGILECLRKLVPLMSEVTPDKVEGLLVTLSPTLTQPRHGIESRLLVAELVADMLLLDPTVLAAESLHGYVKAYLDALLALLTKEADSSATIYALVRRIAARFHPPEYTHPIFQQLQSRAVSLIMDGTESDRLEAVDIVSCAYLADADHATCLLLLLADDSAAVNAKTIRILDPKPATLGGFMKKCGPETVSAVVQRIVDALHQTGHRTGSALLRERMPHMFSILGRVFRAADPASATLMQDLLVKYLHLASTTAARLRSAQFADISKSALALDEYTNLPVVMQMESGASGNHAAAATARNAALNASSAQATAGGGGSGGSGSSSSGGPSMTSGDGSSDPMDVRRAALTGSLAERQAELDYWVHAQVQLLLMLGHSHQLEPAVVTAHLTDEHRGVRVAAIRALLELPLAADQLEPVFTASVAALADDELAASGSDRPASSFGGLTSSTHVLAATSPTSSTPAAAPSTAPTRGPERLYGRKVDHLRLLVGIYCKLRTHPALVIDLLIKAWHDPIRTVRVAAISLVRQLGRDATAAQSRLIEAMGVLVSRDDYPERAMLNGLMTWLILQPGASST